VQLSNLISRIRGESKTVGLDIGHRLARVAVVGHKIGARGTLLALEQDIIPEGVIVDNEIRKVSVLIDRIQALLAKVMPGGHLEGDFAISINWTSGILCDKILAKPVPKVSEDDLLRDTAEAILQKAMGDSSYEKSGNIFDYYVLDRREDGVEAMIVAAKRDNLIPWINLFQALNIKLSAINVDAFVLSNVYSATKTLADASDLPLEDEDDSVLLLNLGYSKSYAALLRGGYFNTARSILGGSVRELQEQLSGPLNTSPEQCGELLMGTGIREAGMDESKLKFATEFLFEEIAMKVDKELRYFSSSDNYKKPSKILVTGGGANIVGLIPFLVDRLSLDMAQLDPFKAVNVDNNNFLGMDWDAAVNIYGVAMGLALRRF